MTKIITDEKKVNKVLERGIVNNLLKISFSVVALIVSLSIGYYLVSAELRLKDNEKKLEACLLDAGERRREFWDAITTEPAGEGRWVIVEGSKERVAHNDNLSKEKIEECFKMFPVK